MRTTVDLPDDLFRAAKTQAATSGETLKEFLTRAVARALEVVEPTPRSRVVLPLVGSSQPPVDVSNEDIEILLAQDDVEKYGGQ